MGTYRSERSFCKSLFSGKIQQDMIFPYPKMNAEEGEVIRIFIESLDGFAKDNIESATIDEQGALPEGILDDIAELGLLGMSIPQEYGGSGISYFAYCRVLEKMARIDISLTITVGAHQSLGLKPILLYGTNEQKAAYLPQCVSGELLAGFALTEPGAGSDASSIRTRATPSSDNSHYILNGTKQWITNGGLGNIFTVFAKTPTSDGKEKISAFIVTRDMKGFSSGKEEKKLGICGSSTTTLSFDNVYIPAGNMIADAGSGFKIAMETLNNGRLGLAAGNLGIIKHVISLAVDHAKSRKQFDTPIALFEMVQSKISQMVIDAYVLESIVYLTASMVDRDDIDFSIETAVCKAYATEASWRAADHALQIAGGIGYSKEYPYERLLRDARIGRIFDGTNEILRSFIGLTGMQDQGTYLKNIGKALQNPLSEWKLILEYTLRKIRHIITTERLSNMHPLLAGEVRTFEKYAKLFQQKVEKCLTRYRKNIINQQFHLERISNMVIDLYAMAAVLSRLNSDLKNREQEQVEKQLVIGKVFCLVAFKRLRKNGREIDSNIDPLKRQIAKGVCEDDGYSLDLTY